MRNLLICLFLLGGCSTVHIEGVGDVGWRTEMYTIYHHVPVKSIPVTPVEWQAKANEECVQILINLRLPDTNFLWKYRKEDTGCIFSFPNNECICDGPPNMSNDRQWPQHARFHTDEGKKIAVQLGF